LGQANDRLEEIERKLQTEESELRKIGKKLSQSRKKVSDLLAVSVTEELKDLKMGDAKFSIELSFKESISDWNQWGGDFIQFVVQTNKGETARPIGKIASGGELSRLMLSIRRVISDRGGIGVYLFDEIDAGIGGQTAFQVGKKLKSVASFNQVICITHLPQVASFAGHHLVVRKSVHASRTTTEINSLTRNERKEELARMLGGPVLTKRSLENASELLELANG
jgi:DNA repair protein RecN (Recombination protein N)